MAATSRGLLVVALTSAVLTAFGISTRIESHPCLRRSRKTELVDLPLDVLIEIIPQLELKDILHIRQTCQRLRDASLSRPVWLSLVQWYSATVQPRPFLPEKPLEFHTDRELEHLVVRWQSGMVGCSRPQQRKRELWMPETCLRSRQLVEGGRWLLFGTFNGSVKYYDLNAIGKAEAVTLVPTLFDEDAKAITLLSLDIDPDAEYTTFNLGIMTCRTRTMKTDPDFPNPPRYARWIEVRRVTSHWDENGQVTGLRAERLACFREVYDSDCLSFTLGGRHVAYSIQSYEPGLSEGENIAIVDWTSPKSTSLDYPRRLIWRQRVRWLELLPDDRLICDDSSHILLFDLKDAAVTTLLPTVHNQPPGQLPLSSFRLYARAISRPYAVHDSIRISVLIEEGVKGLIIPRSRGVSNTMECIDLLRESEFTNSADICYDRAAVFYGSPRRMMMVQFSWPEQLSSFFVSQKIAIELPAYSSSILFDSSCGRIITFVWVKEEICIVDLAVE